ncbi:MAG TPA: hypothetical protein VIT92_16875 [Burkholderiaceae bacterium]
MVVVWLVAAGTLAAGVSWLVLRNKKRRPARASARRRAASGQIDDDGFVPVTGSSAPLLAGCDDSVADSSADNSSCDSGGDGGGD